MNTKSGIQGLLCAGLLSMSMTAGATQVAWSLGGTFDQAPSGSDVLGLGLNLQAGDPFSVTINFDTDTAVTNPAACGTGGTGATCRFNGASASAQFFSGLVLNGQAIPGFRSPYLDDAYFNSLIVRNSAQVGGQGPFVDGYSWGSTAGCDFFGAPGLPLCQIGFVQEFAQAIFRGTEADVVTNASILPNSPPQGLNLLSTRVFTYCAGVIVQTGTDQTGAPILNNDCQFALLQGTFEGETEVPEPGTLALLGLGLAGLGLSRRRKAV